MIEWRNDLENGAISLGLTLGIVLAAKVLFFAPVFHARKQSKASDDVVANKDWEIGELKAIIADQQRSLQDKNPKLVRDFTAAQLVSYFVRESEVFQSLGHGESYRLQFDVQQAACDGNITVWAREDALGSPHVAIPRSVFATHGFVDLAAWLAYEHLDFTDGKDTDERPTAGIRIKQENKIRGSRSTIEYVEPMFCEKEVRNMWPPRAKH